MKLVTNYIEKNLEEYMGKEVLTTVARGEKFLKWVLLYLFDKSDSEIEAQDISEGVLICDGPNDGGIDASFIENDTITLIQTKYNMSNSYENIIAYLEDIKMLLIDNYNQNLNKESIEVLSYCQDIEGIDIFYITNDEINNNEWIKIKNKAKEVEKLITEKSLQKRIRIKILDISNMEEFIDETRNLVPKNFQKTPIEIIVDKYFMNKENNTIIAEVTLKDLARFIKKGEKYLFYSNIRNFLGTRNKVNKKIAETYKHNPKNFWFYNNGITIVCDRFDDPKELTNGAAKVNIITLQIVNGCQTSSTIYSLWKNQSKEERDSQEGTILVKIIQDTKNKRKEITKYTNSQTAVSGKDFFALEDFHLQLQKDFALLGYNYLIQRKEKIDKKDKKRGNKNYSYMFGAKFNNAFFAKDIVQAYAAGMHCKPAKARSISNLVPGGSYYDKLFEENNTPKNPKYYLFPYAVLYYCNNVLGHNKIEKFKSTTLLFVNIYFKTILEIMKQLNIVSDENNDIVHSEIELIEYIDRIFLNEKMNKSILHLSEEILKSFLKDSKIRKEKIGDNLPKFLKSSVETDPEVISILQDKIRDEIEEFNMVDVLELFKDVNSLI